MMQKFAVILMGLAALLVVSTVFAADPLTQDFSAGNASMIVIDSGADFYDRCEALLTLQRNHGNGDTPAYLKADACLGYIHGFRQGHEIGSVVNAMREPGVTAQTANYAKYSAFCVPLDVSDGDLVTTTMMYLERHPEKKPNPAATVLLVAWREAYPCK
jgi:hypothetical protein